jgi:catechol 2,3-dioxygenase-like lactoylglutathione lyase family enzyme/DNA-binding CsgD family transcriptional regulator
MALKRQRGRPPHDDRLTPAEWRVVHAAQHGMNNRQIARRRGISLDAVKFHLANILGKLGLDDGQGLRHWFAVPAASALYARKTAMPDSVQLGRIGQVSRSVADIAASTAFYRDVLGLPHLYTYGDLAFFDCGGLRLYLQKQADPSPSESVLYFQVPDILAAHAALAARGAVFSAAPHRIHTHADGTEEWMAFFADPEGRPLAIMAQAKPA